MSTKCNECSPDECGQNKPTVSYELPVHNRGYKEEDASEYLRPFPRPHSDPTPLNHQCKCEDSPRLPRSACLPCIRSWVWAVRKHEIRKEIEKYKSISMITVDRLEMCLEERKRTER